MTFCSIYSQSAGEIILKKNDLKFFPIIRLSDIYSILPQIDLYTLDGYRHTSLKNNLFEQTPADISILINGVKTNFGFLDKVNLSQLPLDPNAIDSIVIQYYPVNYFGNYSAGILIDFITKEPPEDISFSFNYSTGNEVGDPGPYRYTKYFSNNVDQFGPNTSFNSSYGNKNFGLSLNFVDQVSPATDEAILMRTPDYIFQNYQVRYSGLSVNSYLKNNTSHHSLFTAFSKTGQPLIGYVYGADLYFDDNLSSEIPYESQNIYFVSGNEIFLNDTDIISLDLNIKHSSAKQSRLSDDFNFRLDNLLINTKAGLKSSVGAINYFAGLSIEYQNLQTKSERVDYSRNINSFFALLNFRTTEKLKHNIDFNFRNEKRNTAFFTNVANLYEIHHAIVYLGEREIRRWANLIALTGVDDKPEELITTSLVRARMCELLAGATGADKKDSAFIVGLLHLEEKLIKTPLERLSLPPQPRENRLFSFFLQAPLVDTWETATFRRAQKPGNSPGASREGTAAR